MVFKKEVKVSLILVLMAIFLLANAGLASADLPPGPAYYQSAKTFDTFDFSGSPADLIVSVDNGTPVTITLNQNYPDAQSLANAINTKITGASVDISYGSWTVYPDGSKVYHYDATFMTDTAGSNRSIYVTGSAAPRLGLDTIIPANGTTGATWTAARNSYPGLNISPTMPFDFTVAVDGGAEQKITLNTNYPDLNSIINTINSQLSGATVFDSGGGRLAVRSNNPNQATSAIVVHVPFYELGFSEYIAGKDVPPPSANPSPAPKLTPAPTPALAPAPAPVPAPAPPAQLIQPGVNGEAVNTVQEKLKDLGFDCGAVDGKFGPITEDAVIRYQIANGLVADGIVGPITWGKLFGFNVGPYKNNISLGNVNPAAIGGIQDKLIKLGYNPGILDGIFGNRTLAAIKAFQRAKGLVVDGIVGPITWKALFG